MNNLKRTFRIGILLMVIAITVSCSQGKKSEQAESDEHEPTEMMEEKGHHEGEAHDHDEGEAHHHGDHDEMTMGDNKIWTPHGNGADLIRSDFHFLVGSQSNIKPQVVQVDGTNVLELIADGSPVAFVFHNQYGNVGEIVTFKSLDFQGTIKVVHHAQDQSNYEFVSITGTNMKLGRVVNGTEKIFDEGTFENAPDWMDLKVTAAGTHYKGYIGDKTVTHGHGDKMENGYVGIMLDGQGKLQIKSIETAVLEDE